MRLMPIVFARPEYVDVYVRGLPELAAQDAPSLAAALGGTPYTGTPEDIGRPRRVSYG